MVRALQCKRLTAVALSLACSWSASLAHAEQEAEPIRLAYHAPPACPDEAAFVARVRARTTKVRLAWPGEAARTFTVLVETAPPLGRVLVENRDHSQATRQVRADTCADVVDALALVVALAVDTTATGPSQAAPSPQPPSGAPSPAVAPAARSPGDGGVFGGADFAVATGVEPIVVFAGAPYAGWRATGDRLLAPSFRLAFLRAGSGALPLPGGAAEFTWTVGRLDGCPIAWPHGVLRVAECVRLEAGVLEAAGERDVPASRTAARAWVAAGVLARAEWSFFPPVFVDLETGVLVRVAQDRFYFNPNNTTAFQVPPLGGTVGLGVGVVFF